MRFFLADNKFWLFPILFLVLAAKFVPALIIGPLYLLLLLLFIWKDKVLEFIIAYILLLFFSDSFQTMFGFASTFKPVATLLLPLFVLKLRGNQYFKHDYISWFIPYFLIAIFTVLFAFNPANAAQKTLSYILTFLCIPILANLAIASNTKRFFNSFLILFTLLLAIGMGMKYINYNFVSRVGRFSGLLGNPNGLGVFLLLIFGFFKIMNEIKPESVHRWIKIIFLFATIICLFWCSSRSAMMAIIICQAFSYIYSFSWILGWGSFGVIMFFYDEILMLIPIVTNFLGFGENLRTETVTDIKQGSGRALAREFAWWKIKQSILTGAGIGYTELLYKKWYDWLAIRGHQGNAHNSYLTHWLDTGIIGVVSFFTAVLAVFIKLSRVNKIAMPFLFSVLFSNYYESWITGSLNPFTPIFLVCTSALFYGYNRERKNQEIEKNLTDENVAISPSA